MSGSYLVELDRWKIKNDASDAVNTSKGLNEALAWAVKEGYSEIVLPNGTYLIDENNPIKPQSHTTFNLGGATLRIRDNNLPKYQIVSYSNDQQYSRITNGKIEGDRNNHKYDGGGTHEFGVGIELRHGVEFITIDNLEIYNTTGDAIIGITSYGSVSGMPTLAGNMESGGINLSNGAPTPETNRIRSKVKIPMVKQFLDSGYFGIYGNSYGGIGKEITTNIYDIVFYKSDNSFLSSTQDLRFFDEVEVPMGANYAKVVLHQNNIPSPAGNTLIIRNPQFPKHIYIEKCNLHHCRRLGIAVCGMKHCYISGCEIHHISGTAPQGGIDIEDGYDINQYIYIDGNNIYANKSYNIVAVAGKHISITNNRIQDEIFTINPGVDKAIIQKNFFHKTTLLTYGDILFSDNHLYQGRLRLLGSGEALIDNCYFHNSPINFVKEKAFVAQVNNCQFLYDDDYLMATGNPGAPLIFSVEPQTISNSTFEGNGVEAFTVVPQGAYNWTLNNVSFINTRNQQDRITRLPPGAFNGCQFINCGKLGDTLRGSNSQYDFNDCYFEWDSYTLFTIGQGTNVDFLNVNNSKFSNLNGSDLAFSIIGSWQDIHFSGNTFYYRKGTSKAMIDVIYTTTAKSIRFSNNTFISEPTMVAVKANLSPAVQLIFKDNFLKNSKLQLNQVHENIDNISLNS